jgi:nitroreductase
MADPAEPAPAGRSPGELAELAATLIHSRQTILPKRLLAPGPDARQLATILAAAAAAPDHGQLTPWRFVIVPESARGRLAEVFAASLLERDAQATAEQLAQAREKAYRAPLLLLAIARLEGRPEGDTTPGGDGEAADIDAGERLVSAGCAIQNMLLTAHALGFGAALTSGKALKSRALRALFGLAEGEQALCFLSVGTVGKARPVRQRPAMANYVSVLGGDG